MARTKGSTQLVNIGYGSRINKYGVKFTASEIHKFQNEVQRLNKRLISYTKKMEVERSRAKNAIDSRIPVEPLYNKKSTSLQHFKSKNEYNLYLSKMHKQGSDRYKNWRYGIEVENFKRAITSSFSKEDARMLNAKVNKVSRETLHNAFIRGELEHTGYVYYDPEKSKVKVLSSQLDFLL